MAEVGITFEVQADGKVAPVDWKKVTGHLVWNLKQILQKIPDGFLMNTKIWTQLVHIT